jgi:hypothetical protein
VILSRKPPTAQGRAVPQKKNYKKKFKKKKKKRKFKILIMKVVFFWEGGEKL